MVVTRVAGLRSVRRDGVDAVGSPAAGHAGRMSADLVETDDVLPHPGARRRVRGVRPPVRAPRRPRPAGGSPLCRTTRPTSTTSCPRRSPPCSARCGGARARPRGSTATSSARCATRRTASTAGGRRSDRSATGTTNPLPTRSSGARTRRSCAPRSARCRRPPATCCGGPRSRVGRTPTSPAASARRGRRSPPAASRARDALGGAYLAGHLDLAFDEPPRTPECIEVQRQLVDLVRGNASRRRRRYLERHLDECSQVPGRARPAGAVQRAAAHGAVHGGRGRPRAGHDRRLRIDARTARGLRVARRRRRHRGRHADHDGRRRAGDRRQRGRGARRDRAADVRGAVRRRACRRDESAIRRTDRGRADPRRGECHARTQRDVADGTHRRPPPAASATPSGLVGPTVIAFRRRRTAVSLCPRSRSRAIAATLTVPVDARSLDCRRVGAVADRPRLTPPLPTSRLGVHRPTVASHCRSTDRPTCRPSAVPAVTVPSLSVRRRST